MDGVDIVEEAATDVIALQHGLGITEPHTLPDFTERIARLQVQRMARPATGAVRVSDRSVICTLALAEYLGHAVPALLEQAIAESLAARQFERIERSAIRPIESTLVGIQGNYVEGVATVKGRSVLIMDVGAVLTLEETTLPEIPPSSVTSTTH